MTKEEFKKLLDNRDKGRAKYIVAIDPDVVKSGVALLKREDGRMNLRTIDYPFLVDEIRTYWAMFPAGELRVYIEAGWLNKAHWHLTASDTRQSAAAKGNAAGRNHEVGRMIAAMCKHYGVDYELVSPLRKCWHGKDGKITQKELEAVTGQKFGRTNQEMRDAALIAWHAAELPMIMK